MLYLFFQITVTPYERIVQHVEMHTHTGFSDPLSSRSIVKPRIVCYVGCAPYSVSGTSGCLEEEREWEKKRYLFPATKFSCFQRIFLFRFYITRPYLRAECFAEITCQNAYFLPASKFLFGMGRKNVSMWQNGPLRNWAYYSFYTSLFF